MTIRADASRTSVTGRDTSPSTRGYLGSSRSRLYGSPDYYCQTSAIGRTVCLFVAAHGVNARFCRDKRDSAVSHHGPWLTQSLHLSVAVRPRLCPPVARNYSPFPGSSQARGAFSSPHLL